MDSINRHISNIIKANSDNSLVIFVGAGISKLSETASLKLPVWSDLIEELKKELGDNGESDYLKIAQLYYLEFGEYSYYKLIKSYFPEYIKPSEAHKIIFEINPHVVVTTNWDNILERAVEENAYFYDLVCSDRDLVKSRLQNKLIKMHGDFKSHNIVFKEDDYLNYKYNFPLIENYIKSLLSTHTVLFLGYSYNDINLKQISKWIQQHSTVRPPIYLAAHKDNPTQTRYLENHGITTLILPQEAGDGYLSRSVRFLNRIKSNDLERAVDTDEEAVLYVLDRLKELDGLEGILLEHVRKALSNCGFIYDDEQRSILVFHSDVLTRDIDQNKRNIYNRFVDVIARLDNGENPTKNIVSIFNVLVRARIKGVLYKSFPNGGGEYLEIEKYVDTIDDSDVDRYMDFEPDNQKRSGNVVSGKFDEAYGLYQDGRDEESYVLTEDLILSFLKQRNYILAFIGMFNRNALLYGLKYGFSKSAEKYSSIKEYDLGSRFFNLPKDSQAVTQPLYEFLNFSYMYSEAYRATNKLRSVQNSKRTIERGGSVFGNNVNEMAAVHSNLVCFVLKNRIMIEDYVEYKSTNAFYIQIAITRQAHKKVSILTRVEVFSCIKYVGNKELKEILEHLYSAGKKTKNRLALSADDSSWLVDVVLKNVIAKFLTEDIKSHGASENRLLNVIFLLSLIKHDDAKIKSITDCFKAVARSGDKLAEFIRAVNGFVGHQYVLNKAKLDVCALIDIIEVLMIRFTRNELSPIDLHLMKYSGTENLFSYIGISKVEISNSVVVDNFVTALRNHDSSDVVGLAKGFLMNVYSFSSPEIKRKIKSFVLKIDVGGLNTNSRLAFDLTLIAYKLKNISLLPIEELEEAMKMYEDGTNYSTELFEFLNLIGHILKSESSPRLKKIFDNIDSAIKAYKKRPGRSIL